METKNRYIAVEAAMTREEMVRESEEQESSLKKERSSKVEEGSE